MTMGDIVRILDKCKIAYTIKKEEIVVNKAKNNEHKPVDMSFRYTTYDDDRGTCISYMIGKWYDDYYGIGAWFEKNDTEDTLIGLLRKFGFNVPEVSFKQMRLF